MTPVTVWDSLEQTGIVNGYTTIHVPWNNASDCVFDSEETDSEWKWLHTPSTMEQKHQWLCMW